MKSFFFDFFKRCDIIFDMRKSVLIIFIALMITIFVAAHGAYSVETNDQATKEDVQTLLQHSFPDVKVLEVRSAQVKGLLEVAVETNGQKAIIYVDSSKGYLISGSVIDLKAKTNLTQERYTEIIKKYGEFSKVDVSQIPLDDALVMGDKDAKYRVIVFDDPD
jgi:thiol:disulfide interchange protein DsbC